MIFDDFVTKSSYISQNTTYSRQIGDYSRQSPSYSRQLAEYSRQLAEYSRQLAEYNRQLAEYSRQYSSYSRHVVGNTRRFAFIHSTGMASSSAFASSNASGTTADEYNIRSNFGSRLAFLRRLFLLTTSRGLAPSSPQPCRGNTIASSLRHQLFAVCHPRRPRPPVPTASNPRPPIQAAPRRHWMGS